MGMWSVVIPPSADVTNLITNPSFETGTTSWAAAAGGTLARTTSTQRRGAWSASYAPSAATGDGVYFGTLSLTSGSTYTFGVDVYGASGVPYYIFFTDTAGAGLGTPTYFTGAAAWARQYATYTAASTASYRVTILKENSNSTATFYVDGAAVTAGSAQYLYFDGDSRGFRDGDFYWIGTPHASTSVMRAGTRAGGSAADMQTTYGFYVAHALGIGLAGLSSVITPTPLIGGGVYQRTITNPRQFALAGVIANSSSLQTFQRQRKGLIDALKPEAAPTQQPVLLRYQAQNTAGSAYGDVLELPAVFEGGLEYGETEGFNEPLALKFTAYLPYIAAEEGQAGGSLGYQTTIANANYIIQRNSQGTWSALGTGASGGTGTIETIAVGPDGTVYAGGGFTSIGGASSTARIAKWDGSAWSGMGGSGADDTVLSIAVGPDGTVYAGGGFTSIGGASSTAGVAKWNGSAWSSMGGSGAQSSVHTLAVGPNGTVYAGGVFTTIGGASSTARIAKWDGSAWSGMGGSGANNTVYTIAVSPNGSVYAGGLFTSIGGASSTAYIAKWDGSAWSSMGGSGATVDVYALAVGSDGVVYAGGSFASIGGASSTAKIARWNGSTWAGMGGSGANGNIYALSASPDGIIYAGGTFTSIGNVSSQKSAIWNGSTWIPFESDLPGTPTVESVAGNASNTLYFGYSTSGSAIVETVTALTNAGTANAYPTFKITGPGVLAFIKNYTTGDNIYFNLTVLAGETAYLDLTPGAIRFNSNFRTNLLNTILPGSNLATFRLVPGSNNVSVFISSGTSAATAVSAYWRSAHLSIDGGAN